MKFYETHFEEYIEKSEKKNLHPKFQKEIDAIPSNLKEMKNLILYGPTGTGKYTQALKIIKKFSPSKLKYEKKITILFNKQPFYIKISDIHFEIDMALLGCNAKILWNDIFNHIIDIISTSKHKKGIIVCKNFHEIHSELLEIFYSYMQTFHKDSIFFNFIIITEHISFIPDNISNCCKVLSIPRPTKTAYNKCVKNTIPTNVKINTIRNVKYLKAGIKKTINPYKNLCDPIVERIINVKEMKFLQFRDFLYDLFIYNLLIEECVWYILSELSVKKQLDNINILDLITNTYKFFKLFNNNYRPIYHLESYMFYLTRKIHGFT